MNPNYIVRLKDGSARQVLADDVIINGGFVAMLHLNSPVALFQSCEIQEVVRSSYVAEGE
ncbi:hypothetical protein [Pseudomonas phage LKD16]|uniref:Uncharacterized protein n=1 Tax=Pseudomonas phage LKD16 TaxID=386792 RepID=Q0E659_9CAUD|nr:hypothetical protein PPLKD16_gp06 [Pseudomonas phage LKD16]CAK25940.1 hypothetical protein [Pseudomonas phage LKD16]